MRSNSLLLICQTVPFKRSANRLEKELARTGTRFSKPLHKRLKFLLRRLHPVFQIQSLMMGMGGWNFKVKPFVQIHSDGSVGEGDGSDFTNALSYADNWTLCWEPAGITQKHLRAMREIEQLLEFLTDERYAQLLEFDWSATTPST